MHTKDILNSNQLKNTHCRNEIIAIMEKTATALTEKEIKQMLSTTYDRTTLYRTLKRLVQHDILHKIVIDERITTYSIANKVTQKEEHPHFFCIKCNKVFCLHNLPIQVQNPSEEYLVTDRQLLFKGLCKTCLKKNAID